VANDRDEIAVTTRLDPNNAEAIVGILVGDALNQPGQHFPIRWLRLRLHDVYRSGVVAKTLEAGAEVRRPPGWNARQAAISAIRAGSSPPPRFTRRDTGHMRRRSWATGRSNSVPAAPLNLLIGRAAFETAKRLYPKDRIEYRKGAMVLDKSGGEGGMRRNAFCYVRVVKRDDLTDMIAAAADYIPRGRRSVIGLYLSAIVILVVFVVLLSSGG
jgi:hypothetical protein